MRDLLQHVNNSHHAQGVGGVSVQDFDLCRGSDFLVKVLGFRVQGSGFRVQGSGFRVQVLRFRVQGSGFMRKVLGEFLSRTLTWVSNMYSFHRSHHPRVEESPSLLNMEMTEGRISTTPSL